LRHIIDVRFHWFPENVAHVALHDLTPGEVEAIFGADDFAFRQSLPEGRNLYRVAFTRPGPAEVYLITTFRIRRRRP
jgi:hypothetical protein